jgi:hypothetical protein
MIRFSFWMKGGYWILGPQKRSYRVVSCLVLSGVKRIEEEIPSIHEWGIRNEKFNYDGGSCENVVTFG